MRWFCLLLLVVLGWTTLVGCAETGPPPPLTPEEERQLEEHLEQARRAEAAAQTRKN